MNDYTDYYPDAYRAPVDDSSWVNDYIASLSNITPAPSYTSSPWNFDQSTTSSQLPEQYASNVNRYDWDKGTLDRLATVNSTLPPVSNPVYRTVNDYGTMPQRESTTPKISQMQYPETTGGISGQDLEEKGWFDKIKSGVEDTGNWAKNNPQATSGLAAIAAFLTSLPGAKAKAEADKLKSAQEAQDRERAIAAQARSNSPLLSTGAAPSIMNRQFLGLSGQGDVNYGKNTSSLRNSALYSNNKLG